MQRFVFVLALAFAFASGLALAAQSISRLPNPTRAGYALYELTYGDAVGCVYVFGNSAAISAIMPMRVPAGEHCPELDVR